MRLRRVARLCSQQPQAARQHARHRHQRQRPGAGGRFRRKTPPRKGQLYEGGIREPLVVWGPGLVDASAEGETNDTSVLSSVDLVASLFELAGAETPKDIDGEDLSATLLGKQHGTRRSPLFWVAPPDRRGSPQENLPAVAVREGQWKLLLDGDGQKVRLYEIDARSARSGRRRPAACRSRRTVAEARGGSSANCRRTRSTISCFNS